jgi:hypothetical protein
MPGISQFLLRMLIKIFGCCNNNTVKIKSDLFNRTTRSEVNKKYVFS